MSNHNILFWEGFNGCIVPDAWQYDKGQLLYLPSLQKPEDANSGAYFRIEMETDKGLTYIRNLDFDGTPHVTLPDEIFLEPGLVRFFLAHICGHGSGTISAAEILVRERPPASEDPKEA